MVNFLFYLFASLAVLSALLLILSNNPVNSVISMIFTFICTAAIWILLHQAYLALLLIVVYVGAVLVMFLFVIFMLDLDINREGGVGRFFYSLSAVIVCIVFGVIIGYSVSHVFYDASMSFNVGSLRVIGLTMFDDNNLYIFELVDFILLSAMTAAITLTLRSKSANNKSVNPSKQIKVKAKDRLKMVKFPNNK